MGNKFPSRYFRSVVCPVSHLLPSKIAQKVAPCIIGLSNMITYIPHLEKVGVILKQIDGGSTEDSSSSHMDASVSFSVRIRDLNMRILI